MPRLSLAARNFAAYSPESTSPSRSYGMECFHDNNFGVLDSMGLPLSCKRYTINLCKMNTVY